MNATRYYHFILFRYKCNTILSLHFVSLWMQHDIIASFCFVMNATRYYHFILFRYECNTILSLHFVSLWMQHDIIASFCFVIYSTRYYHFILFRYIFNTILSFHVINDVHIYIGSAYYYIIWTFWFCYDTLELLPCWLVPGEAFGLTPVCRLHHIRPRIWGEVKYWLLLNVTRVYLPIRLRL